VIKAKLSGKDGPVLLFGLSHENLRRLKARQPIHFDLSELGIEPSIPVVIMAGKDEAAIQAELSEWFDLP
jgi:hypothetical protein